VKVWIAAWSILAKDARTYYLKPPNVSWGLIFPLAWTGMLFLRSAAGVESVAELLPGVMAVAVLFGTTSLLAVVVAFERRGRSFERLLVAPIPLVVLLLAKTGGAILFGLVNAFVPVILAAFLIDLSIVDWPALIGAAALLSASSAFLGLFIAVSVREVFEAQALSNFFRFPMLFLCGLFLPVEQLPAWMRRRPASRLDRRREPPAAGGELRAAGRVLRGALRAESEGRSPPLDRVRARGGRRRGGAGYAFRGPGRRRAGRGTGTG